MDAMETAAHSDQTQKHQSFVCFFSSDWQMWTEQGQRATVAAIWLAFCPATLHSDTGSPLNVIISELNPLPPQWGPLCLLSSFTPISNQPLLILPPFDSLRLYLYRLPPLSTSHSPSVAKMAISGTAGCLLRAERDTVIKLNGLNMSLSGIFIKPIHQGRPGVAQLGDLNTNISDYWVCFQDLHLHPSTHTNNCSAVSLHVHANNSV